MLYLFLFALAFARYGFEVVSLENKIHNLIFMAKGKYTDLTQDRAIEIGQIKIPSEPRIYNPISILTTLIPAFDEINQDTREELRAWTCSSDIFSVISWNDESHRVANPLMYCQSPNSDKRFEEWAMKALERQNQSNGKKK